MSDAMLPYRVLFVPTCSTMIYKSKENIKQILGDGWNGHMDATKHIISPASWSIMTIFFLSHPTAFQNAITLSIKLFIMDCEAGEIIRLVVSVCLFVCPSSNWLRVQRSVSQSVLSSLDRALLGTVKRRPIKYRSKNIYDNQS